MLGMKKNLDVNVGNVIAGSKKEIRELKIELQYQKWSKDVEKRRKKYFEIQKLSKLSNEKLKELKKIKYRIYCRNKRKTDMQYCLAGRMRSRIKNVLKGKNKSKKTEKLLGCSVLQFKKYIESRFQPGMSWDKKHLFHIDHIRPCASFDLTIPEEQAKCFHYTNLQPLWAKDNLSKGAKYDG